MTSWKNRVTAAIATAAIAASMLPVSALGLIADTEISVTGIDAGDTAAYYQVIKQNADTKAWELTGDFTSLDLTQTTANKKTNEDRAAAVPSQPALTTLDFILDGIDADEAALIAAKAVTPAGNLDGTTYKAEVAPGMYLVLVTPAGNNKDVVYKPIIVSADYDQTTSPNTVAANTASLPTPTTAAAKKSPLTLNKTSSEASTNASKQDGAASVAVGDTVEFKVETNIPTYTGNFEKPVFKITDTLSAGLTMTADQQTAISVAVAGYELKSTDYTVTPSATGYTVEFNGAEGGFLYTVTGNPKVTITYKATVTSTAQEQVNEMDNTVKLNFSNTPSDKTGQGELTDKTRHYTFDIDGNIFGSGSSTGTPDKTKEVEKVGVDGNGNIIKKITYTDYPDQLPNESSFKEQPLGDAEFELRTSANDKNSALKFNDSGVLDANGSTVVKSNSDGSITMKGLDEGTYFLVETKAPAGYSFDPTPHTVVIDATYVNDADGNSVLSSYTVTIDGNTSTYTAKTEKVVVDGEEKDIPIELTDEAAAINVTANNQTTLLINKKLGILPSTGGSGIYFYLVLGGAIAGVSAYYIQKTKKQEELLAQ